ncbi:MAG: nuclear transport factor 2 family protein [Mycobacteriales bacterium]
MSWSREELEEAFGNHGSTIAGLAGQSDWEPFVQLFVPDVEYVDPMMGTMRGHDEIRTWANAALGTFPGSAMTYPESWHLVDEARGWIVCELRDVMRDPGDGSLHELSHITVLHYAGDGLFSLERDVYDPAAFISLIESWGRRSAQLGSLTEAETEWFAQSMPAALEF